MGIDRWLEFGVVSALLIVVVVYILRYHMPTIIRSFSEGMRNIAVALKEVNKSLTDLQLLVTLKAEKASRECYEKCQHERERDHDAVVKRVDRMEKEMRKMEESMDKLRSAVERFLS
jgi:F0F1-type ATP synthase membrane subunit b/b'